MERSTTRLGILAAALLCLVPSAAPAPAFACDDGQAQVITLIVTDDTPAPAATAQTPPPARPPRAPRSGSAATPAAPAPPAAPEPPDVPYPPPAAEAPEAPTPPAMIRPRGWFGLALEGKGMTVDRTDSSVVWRFTTRPHVYSVESGSPASQAGLRRGDLVVGIDGLSILTPAAGRHFGRVKPGQVVRWTVIRDGERHSIAVRAADQPGRPAALLDLQREVRRLSELRDDEDMRRALDELNRQMNSRRQEVRVQVYRGRPPVKRFRYAGVIGDSEVEVRGPDGVIVNTDGNEMIISIGESTVKIRTADATRDSTFRKTKRKSETPK